MTKLSFLGMNEQDTSENPIDPRYPEKRWPIKASFAWCYIIVSGFLAAGCLAGTILGCFVLPKPWAILAVSPLIAFLEFFFIFVALHNWRQRNAALILNADGITCTTGKEPLLFSEAKAMNCFTSKSIIFVAFQLKDPRKPKWKWLPIPVVRAMFSLQGVDGNQTEVAETIQRYFSRHLLDTGAD
jgi:hypothetical protein